MLRRALVASSVFAAMVSLSTSVFAQAAPKGTSVLIDGTVAQVVPQGIVANDKSGKKYAIGFDAKSKVGLKGTAGLEFVTPGTYVQFDVDLDGKMQPTGIVKKLQITSQGPLTEPGIFSAKGPDGKPGEPGPYFVRGTVRTNKDNKLTVSAGGGKQMTVELAEAITVPVTIADWKLAKPGDALKGNGMAYAVPPGAPMTPVLCEQIEITAVAPIQKKRPGQR